jgi:hypothetical protein
MASTPNGAAATSSAAAGAAPPVDKEVDFANYFCTYAYLYHQKEMLCDRVRMDAYHSAVFRNPHHFRGKVRKRFLPVPTRLQIARSLILAAILGSGLVDSVDLSGGS